MKLLIASDIHGSSYYCNLLVNAFKKENADKLLLLGDLLYHGPRNDLPKDYSPKLVIEMLNSLKEYILCVRGNCDTEVDQMVLDFPVLADYAYLSVDGVDIFATHGHVFNENNLPKLKNCDVLLHGHTHVPVCKKINNFTVMNPGSTSIPKEQSAHGYILFENGVFLWKNFDGEIVSEYNLKGENI